MNDCPNIAFEAGDHIRFRGAKVTVFVGSRIVTLLRDDVSHIPWPNHWDLPGGGRENGESAWDCAARETAEEVALRLSRRDVIWGRSYHTDGATNWFFVARVSESRAFDLNLGDEGQEIRLVTVDQYLSNPRAIPNFQKRLADWVSGFPM